MMQIPCPCCGLRDQSEFVCGGESHIIRPGPPDQVSDEVWADYLFFRHNPRGRNYERWRHAYGCGLWFNLVRDTVTHEVLHAYRMTEPKPAEAA